MNGTTLGCSALLGKYGRVCRCTAGRGTDTESARNTTAPDDGLYRRWAAGPVETKCEAEGTAVGCDGASIDTDDALLREYERIIGVFQNDSVEGGTEETTLGYGRYTAQPLR